MNSEIQKSSQQNSVSVFNETLEQFKSLFYLAKGKRDTQIKLFNDYKSFSRQSIIDLNEKIEKKLLNYEISNKLSTISINLSGNNIKTYGNWQEFLNQTWDTAERTESITVNWDFEMILPNRIHTLPQTHSLKVRLGNKLKPNEFFHIMMVGGDEFEIEESQAQMVAKVDFINNNIATELLAIVNDWYNALPDGNVKNKFNIFFEKNNFKLRMLTEILILISGLCLFYPLSKIIINNKISINNVSELIKCNFLLFSGVFLTISIFSRIGAYFAQRVNSIINNLIQEPFFKFTIGDNNELARIEKQNKSLRNELITKLIISLMSSSILYGVGFLIKYLYEFIKSSS